MKWALILLVLTSCTTAHSSTVDWDKLDYVDIKDEHTKIHGGMNSK